GRHFAPRSAQAPAPVGELVVTFGMDLDPSPALGLEPGTHLFELLSDAPVEQLRVLEVDLLSEEVRADRAARRLVGLAPDEDCELALRPDHRLGQQSADVLGAVNLPSLERAVDG